MKLHSIFTKTASVALAAILLHSCQKEDTPLSNVEAFRKDNSQAQVLDMSTISTNTVLKDRVNGVDYLITNNVELNANLTIEPGVTLMFDNGAGLVVNGPGSITAIGDNGNEILFTSKAGKRGAWKGITILSNNAKNVLSYCKIEQGGGDNVYGTANVVVGSGSTRGSVEISHSTITASNTDGILLSKSSELNYFTNNNIQTNSAYGITLYADDAFQMDNSNTFTNNGKEGIHVLLNDNGLVKNLETKGRIH